MFRLLQCVRGLPPHALAQVHNRPGPREMDHLTLHDDDDDDEPTYAEEADALLVQMRQLREAMQQESGILQQKVEASEQERTAAQQNLGRTVASIVADVARTPSLVVDVANGERIDQLQPASSIVDGAAWPTDAHAHPQPLPSSSSPQPIRPSPPARQLGAQAKGGKAPRAG